MTTDTVGGVWTYSMELCKALAAYNVRFFLVTMGGHMQPWQAREVGTLKNVTVYETGYKLEWMEDPWAEVDAAGEYLLALQRVVQADLVHLNGYAHASLDWNIPVLLVAHSEVYSWFWAVKTAEPPKEWKTYFHRVRGGLRKAHHVVAPSRAMLNELERIYGPVQNCSVIHNGRDAGDFYSAQKEKTVLSIGRIWDEAKNIQLLARAAGDIPYKVKIAGDTVFENNQVKVENRAMAFLGKLSTEQIAKELSVSSLYVLPARYEPFGLSVLEAALSHCTLVLGDIPSLRELWGQVAVFVRPDDPESLVSTIKALMEDEGKRRSLAEKAFTRAQRFTPQQMAMGYFNLYEQLLEYSFTRQGKTIV